MIIVIFLLIKFFFEKAYVGYTWYKKLVSKLGKDDLNFRWDDYDSSFESNNCISSGTYR